MDTFGYYRVAGLLHKNNLLRKAERAASKIGGFLFIDLLLLTANFPSVLFFDDLSPCLIKNGLLIHIF